MAGPFWRTVFKLHLPIAEINDLSHAGGQPVEAVASIKKTRAERQRQLIGIALPVGTAEAVVMKQLAETKGQIARVKNGNDVLITPRNRQVLRPGFQGLHLYRKST